MMKQSKVEDLLPTVLSRTEWQRVSLLVLKMQKQLKEQSSEEQVILPQVFFALLNGENEGWVKRQTRYGKKTLGNPSGTFAEFRLTGAGRRVKAEKSPSGFGNLAPKLT